MIKEILVNVDWGETRAAVREDNKLVEHYIERDNDEKVAGSIYKGVVENVLPGMDAAFVNIGLERNAFLYVDDINAQTSNDKDGYRRRGIDEMLHEGQDIIVQVEKEPIGTKGARVVTDLSLPGRYLVLMPTGGGIGVSRRISDERERQRLRRIAQTLKPEGMGLIVRTVAEGRRAVDLANDCKFLLNVWKRIKSKARRAKAPALLYKDHDLVYRIIRDQLTEDVNRLVLDSEAEYRKALELLDILSPQLKSRVFLYREDTPIFEAFGIEREIEHALRRRVWLDCGGYIVIDQTEALFSIDVNTGKYTGNTNLADTVLRTNLEAAVEVARQLRLRNIGGIIVVDFIDMDSKDDEARVLEALEKALARDKTKAHVLGFTRLGLVEITRKKVEETLGSQLQKTCPYCEGTGSVLSEETVARKVQRQIMLHAEEDDCEAMLVRVHPSVAAIVIGANGSNLRRLEERTGKTIYVKGQAEMHLGEIEVTCSKTRADIERKALPVQPGEVLQVEVEEPHLNNISDGIARVEGYVINVERAGGRIGERLHVEITQVHRTYARARIVN